MCDGAVKCRFLCFLDEADTFLFNFMVNQVLDTTLKSKSQSQFGVVCATSLEVATVYHFLQDSANRDGEPFLSKKMVPEQLDGKNLSELDRTQEIIFFKSFGF